MKFTIEIDYIMTCIEPTEPDSPEEEYYYPSPEDFEPEPPRPRGLLSQFPSAKHLRPAVLCFVLFYLASVLFSKYTIGDQLWVSGQTVFSNHEYWRLFTSLFTHRDLVHLLSNALMFLIFGWLLRAYFGFLIFPVISFLIGIAGTLFTISLYEPQIRLIGASGMIYGMAALWLIFYIRFDTDHYPAMRIARVAVFIMVMLFPSTLHPQTSYLAHALGFATGVFTGLLLIPKIKVRDPR